MSRTGEGVCPRSSCSSARLAAAFRPRRTPGRAPTPPQSCCHCHRTLSRSQRPGPPRRACRPPLQALARSHLQGHGPGRLLRLLLVAVATVGSKRVHGGERYNSSCSLSSFHGPWFHGTAATEIGGPSVSAGGRGGLSARPRLRRASRGPGRRRRRRRRRDGAAARLPNVRTPAPCPTRAVQLPTARMCVCVCVCVCARAHGSGLA